MGAIFIILGIQWFILLIWVILSALHNDPVEIDYPSFPIALVLMFIPLGMIILLLVFLYRRDKHKKT